MAQDGSALGTARDGAQYLARRLPLPGGAARGVVFRRPGPLGDWAPVLEVTPEAVGYELGLDVAGRTVFAIGLGGHSHRSDDGGATWARCDVVDDPPGAGSVPAAPDWACWGLRSGSAADHVVHGADGVTVAVVSLWGADQDYLPVVYRQELRVMARWRASGPAGGRFAAAGLAALPQPAARPLGRPFVGRDAAGRWRIGWHHPTRYVEFRSDRPVWNDRDTGHPGFAATWQEVSPGGGWPDLAAGLDRCAWAAGRDGTQVLAGWHLTAGAMVVLRRAGWGLPWYAGGQVAAPDAAPYVTQLPDGRWELGWVDDAGAGWTRYRAASPTGLWRAV